MRAATGLRRMQSVGRTATGRRVRARLCGPDPVPLIESSSTLFWRDVILLQKTERARRRIEEACPRGHQSIALVTPLPETL